MNIHELEKFNLADAVRFNDQLNPKLWGKDENLLPQVRDSLLKIADDFRIFLGVPELNLKDITISGSNAAYTYTPHSDIDLHLVVELPELNNEVYRELFNAKKYQYNDEHDIKIGGYDVELYVQPTEDEHVSSGAFSVLNNKWIDVPKPRKSDVNDFSVKSKYEDIGYRIEKALDEKDYTVLNSLWDKIKEMRKTGLATSGEFGPENLAFKLLRNHGMITKLKDAINDEKDRQLSIAEKAKVKKKVRYGFRENVNNTEQEKIQMFTRWCAKKLGLNKLPKIKIISNDEYSKYASTFGRFSPDNDTIHVQIEGRHLLDVFRTLAHELVHYKQNEREGLPSGSGVTGSKYENEANAKAGIIMRDFNQSHPEYFDQDNVAEGASGYIPTKAQANDKRFSNALTVDVRPGEIGRQANKLGLQVSSQGQPAPLIKNKKTANRK